jgi:putative transposase
MEATIMLKDLNFTTHNVSDFNEGFQLIDQDLQQLARDQLKHVMQSSIMIEFERHMLYRKHERNAQRSDYRNGYRTRCLYTSFGVIEDIVIPRSRHESFVPSVLDRYTRIDKTVNNGILKMFLMGVSTRKVSDVLQALLGFTVSASHVSRVAKQLDEEVKIYLNRPLKNDFVYLFLDGIHLKVRHISKSVNKVVLVAYGIRKNGVRELISFKVGKSEGKGTWSSFLNDLKIRGLSGSALDLIISDGAKGLWAAAAEVYPFVEHQLCWAHKLRNVANCLPMKYREQCVDQARSIYQSTSIKLAMKQFRKWEERWKEHAPKAVLCLKKDLDKLLPFLNCPPSHHIKIRTTNVIERQFRELRRRFRVMGSFPDTRCMHRMVYAMFSYYNTRFKRNNMRIKQIQTHEKQVA